MVSLSSFSFPFLTSILLLFEGRRIKERKEREKRKERKKEREKRNYFAWFSLDLYLKTFRKLLASVLKIRGKNGETGFARRYEVRPFLAPLPGVIEPRIESMPFALPKYNLRFYSNSKCTRNHACAMRGCMLFRKDVLKNLQVLKKWLNLTLELEIDQRSSKFLK